MNGERPNSLASGFAALAHRKLVLLLAVTTTVLGISAAMPLAPILSSALAGTLAGDHLIRNAPTFAPTDLFDLLREKWPAFLGAWRAAGWVGILGVVLQMFFAGGIIAVVGRGPFGFGQFLEPARRNFWHNVKCFLIFAALASAVLGAWFGGEAALADKLFENAPPDAPARAAARWGTLVVGALLCAILALLYDFARAARRYAPMIGAWRGYRFAWRALSGAWLRAFAVLFFWLLVGAVVVGGLFAITWSMPAVSVPAIALLFLLQFLMLCARSAVRVATWGSYIGFLEPRARRAVAATAKLTYTVAQSFATPQP